MISEGGERKALGGVAREQKMIKGHAPRVIYHQVYQFTKGGKSTFSLYTGSVIYDVRSVKSSVWRDSILGWKIWIKCAES